jgi:hypothetical protein
MNRYRIVLFVALLGCGISAALAADQKDAVELPKAVVDPLEADLKIMQGRWVREVKNPQGAVFLIEKQISGNRDTITELDPNGNVIHSHGSDFKLSQEGSVRVYTYSNQVVTAGPKTGAQQLAPSSFLYRVNAERFVEVWGLRDGDPQVLNIFIWQRPK